MHTSLLTINGKWIPPSVLYIKFCKTHNCAVCRTNYSLSVCWAKLLLNWTNDCSIWHRFKTIKILFNLNVASRSDTYLYEAYWDWLAASRYRPIFNDQWWTSDQPLLRPKRGWSEGSIRRHKAQQLNLWFSVLSLYYLFLFSVFSFLKPKVFVHFYSLVLFRTPESETL